MAGHVVLPDDSQWVQIESNIEEFLAALRSSEKLSDTFDGLIRLVWSNERIFGKPSRSRRCRALLAAVARVFDGELDYFRRTIKAVLSTLLQLREGDEIPFLSACRVEGEMKEMTLNRLQVLGLVASMMFSCLPEQPSGELRPDCDFAYIRELDVEKACCILRFIGGGVLEGGNVQEEIRFSICPELIVSMLGCEVMIDNEAIRIEGATRFSRHKGYGSAFEWLGMYDTRQAVSQDGIRDVSIFCVDALEHPGLKQFSSELVLREIRKFHAGVCTHAHESARARGIATGNWGCGVFGGDPQLKFIIQWIASSLAGRPVLRYYPYGEKKLERLAEFVEFVKEYKVSRLAEIAQKLQSSSAVFQQVMIAL
ncbi:hypothetical protein FOL47_008557 [Perkinsus chesapeaki]|uniref:PARG catalytic Macro domain-containing protein n=1 Tax=Perkinsus chesapeaki TaxID=330153 RepID=A0A7J6LDA3_PERCH|nr:hypothetical protein FOL47_008557 [Perkinsus chesapeaki]